MIVIDGKNSILGRLASTAAKKLLAGEEVTVVNAESIIITGTPKKIVARYLGLRQIGSPQHGPFFPRHADGLVKRTIRSMMPYKTNKGRAAFKKLRVYTGTRGLQGEPRQHDAQSASSNYVKTIKSNYVTVGEVARLLGGKTK